MVAKLEELLRWLEEDGHPGCADDLLNAAPAIRPSVARLVARHCEVDPLFEDSYAKELPALLREWAAEQEAS